MAGTRPDEDVFDRDRRYVDEQRDPAKRETIACALAAHRRPDRLKIGDPAPDLTLLNMEGVQAVSPAGPRDRPLLLIFASYT